MKYLAFAKRRRDGGREATNAADMAAWIARRLEEASDPVVKEGQLQYFRAGSQERESIRNYGVRRPRVDQVEKEVYRVVKRWRPAERKRLCELLWKSGTIEEGGIACYLMRRYAKQAAETEFRIYTRWIDRYVHNWAHCDGVSSWLLAAAIGNCPGLRFELRGWTSSRNRWKRRAAAVALLQEAKYGRHTGFLLEIAEALRGDADDMVQKGTGWLLKVAYAEKPREVVDFLNSRPEPFSRLTLRYAAEKMSPEDRASVLGSR